MFPTDALKNLELPKTPNDPFATSRLHELFEKIFVLIELFESPVATDFDSVQDNKPWNLKAPTNTEDASTGYYRPFEG